MKKMNRNLLFLIKYLFLIVITDPYKGINYEEINTYEIHKKEISIGYNESDGYKEDFDDDNDEYDIDEIVDSLYKREINNKIYDNIYMYNSNMLFTPLNGYNSL